MSLYSKAKGVIGKASQNQSYQRCNPYLGQTIPGLIEELQSLQGGSTPTMQNWALQDLSVTEIKE